MITKYKIWRQRFLQRQVFQKMFWSTLLLTSLMILIVSAVLFVFFSRSSLKEVGEISKSMLKQTSYAADIVRDQVHTVGNQLINERSVTNAMFNPKVDRVEEYTLNGLLARLQSVYTFIDYIGIYNEFTDRYINTKGLTIEDEKKLLDSLQMENARFSSLFPRKTTYASSSTETELLTFLLKPGPGSLFSNKGAIVINVKQSYITNLLQELRSNSSNLLIVTDSQGTILSRTDGQGFLQSAANEPYMKRILNSTMDSSSFSITLDGKKNLVSYVRSDELGWFFVSVNPYEDILGNLNDLRRVVFSIAVLLLVISVFIVFFQTNNMYNPLDQLVRSIHETTEQDERLNEYSILSQAFNTIAEKADKLEPALSAVHKGRLLKLIKGNIDEDPIEGALNLSGPYFNVTIIKIDDYEAFKTVHDMRTQAVIRFAIGNISEELTGREAIILEEDEIALLGQLSEPADENGTEQLQELQQVLSSYFNLSVTISIGQTIGNASAIHDSYNRARQLLRNRFLDGTGQIYSASMARNHEAWDEDALLSEYREAIVQAITSGEGEELSLLIERVGELMRKLSYEHSLFQLNRFLNDLFRQTNQIPAVREEAYAFLELAYSLISVETINEAVKRINDVAQSISRKIEARSKNRYQDIITEIKQYIDAEYGNPNFSLDFLADRFQLSAGYLGKMFKRMTGTSFSDYLKETRMEKARELLIETRLTVTDISEKVGVYNVTYFYSLFKKKYGISPVQYREEYHRNNIPH